MSDHEIKEQEFSFKNYFLPLTKTKAFHFIAIIGIIVYFNFLFNAFVWDDVSFILNNPQVDSINIVQSFAQNKFNSEGYYRPIPALYFSTVYSLFNDQPFFYHFIQIFFDIVITCLLYVFFTEFFTNILALFLCLIFLVHPIQVESVGYIASTQSELFSLFGISALLMSRHVKTNLRLCLIGLLLVLALLTKEVSIVFLFLVLIWQVFYKKTHIKPFILIDIIVVVIYSFIRFVLAGVSLEKVQAYPIAMLPLSERLLNIPAIFWYYLKTFFFPKDLAILQQWTVTK